MSKNWSGWEEKIFEMEEKCDLIENAPRCTFDSKQNRIVVNANIIPILPETHFQLQFENIA